MYTFIIIIFVVVIYVLYILYENVYRDAIRINICMPLREMDICKIRKKKKRRHNNNNMTLSTRIPPTWLHHNNITNGCRRNISLKNAREIIHTHTRIYILADEVIPRRVAERCSFPSNLHFTQFATDTRRRARVM